MSKRKNRIHRKQSQKSDDKSGFEISKQAWTFIVAVISAALAMVLGQWVIDQFVSPTSPNIDVVQITPPNPQEMAFLTMAASSPYVGYDDQNRFIIAGLEPYEYGVLNAADLSPLMLSLQIVNTGNKPTTVSSFRLKLFTSPSTLKAVGTPLNSETETIGLDVGESQTIDLRFEFGGLQPTQDIPDFPGDANIENVESEGVLQITVEDIEGIPLTITSKFKVGQTQPDHKLYSWTDSIEGHDTFSAGAGVIPLEYLDPRQNPIYAGAYAELGERLTKYAVSNPSLPSTEDVFYQAIELLTYAISLDNQQANTFFYRGNAYDELGQFEEAILNYKRVIELEPTHFQAQSNLGYVYTRQGLYEEAEIAFLNAKEISPEVPLLLVNLSVMQLHNERYEPAIENLKQVTLLDPNDGAAYYYLSIAYEMTGNSDDAQANRIKANALGYVPDEEPGFELFVPATTP